MNIWKEPNERTNEYTEHRTEIFEQCSLIMIIWIAEENCNRQTLAKAMYAQFGGGVGVGDGGGGGDGEDDCLWNERKKQCIHARLRQAWFFRILTLNERDVCADDYETAVVAEELAGNDLKWEWLEHDTAFGKAKQSKAGWLRKEYRKMRIMCESGLLEKKKWERDSTNAAIFGGK